MSNALAVATVTTALEQIVRGAAQSIVPGSDVVRGRPDENATPGHRVHLFLYQITPNAALRNADLPTRRNDGSLVQRPVAAFDLHYLLAFYGDDTLLETHRMLGAVVRDLHSFPVLTRQMIADAVASQTELAGSDLADSIEQIKFTPLGLSLEDLSKLWSVFFQTPYALSVAYQGTVVLIESTENGAAPLPVLRRGELDRGPEAVLGPFPAIENLHVGRPDEADTRPRPASYPSAELGLLVTLNGRNLGGDTVRVRFEHARVSLSKEIAIPETDRTPERVRVTIPSDVAAETEWAPGLYSAAVIATHGTSERSSNRLPLNMAAKIKTISPNPVTRDGSGTATLTVTCAPQAGPTQQVSLLIADREAVAGPHPGFTSSFQFAIANAPAVAGAVARLRIDGVDSLPFRRQDAPPPPRLVFDDAQKVTIT